MTSKEYVIEKFGEVIKNLTFGIEKALEATKKGFKEVGATKEDYVKISKELYRMSNQLERLAEKWLNMK